MDSGAIMRAAADWLLFVRAWITWALQTVGYWVRPYDMLTDRRRWFWQPRQRCGF